MVARKIDDPVTRSTLEAVRRFNEAFDRQDVDGIMAAMTEDCVFENTCPPPTGSDMRDRDR
ncbi:MAG: nuclear transport factor 2 family protein [Candidatus Deferrimicrobiaceae bacterium]